MPDDSDHGMHPPLIYDTAATHSIFSSRDRFADYQNIVGVVAMGTTVTWPGFVSCVLPF